MRKASTQPQQTNHDTSQTTSQWLPESEATTEYEQTEVPVHIKPLLKNSPMYGAQRQALMRDMARQYGNKQVQRFIRSINQAKLPVSKISAPESSPQRKNITSPAPIQRTIDGKHDLTSPRFKGDEVLEACYDDERSLHSGDKGDHVTKVQTALLELDPTALPKFGADGKYGNETTGAVRKFQLKHTLSPAIGHVGPKTMTKLNELFPPKKDDPAPPEPSTAELVLQVVENADEETHAKLRSDAIFMNSSQQTMNETQFGKLCALLILIVPDKVVSKDAARKEAIRILSTMLGGDKEVARRTVDKNVEVIIVPQNTLMTDLPQFANLKGVPITNRADDQRTWDETRGSGGAAPVKKGGKIFTAITEENLLGTDPTAEYTDKKDGKKKKVQTYEKGYSTSTHEFAHTLHNFALGDTDKAVIASAWTARTAKAKANPTDVDQWVDGKQGCYASTNDLEFFAQLTNAYAGSNGGDDPFTHDTRQNTKEWVKDHEPEVFKIIDRVMGGKRLPGTNARP